MNIKFKHRDNRKNIKTYRDIFVNVSEQSDLSVLSIIHSPVSVWDWYLQCHFALLCKSCSICSEILHWEDSGNKADNITDHRDKNLSLSVPNPKDFCPSASKILCKY